MVEKSTAGQTSRFYITTFVDKNHLHYINWDIKVHDFINWETCVLIGPFRKYILFGT